MREAQYIYKVWSEKPCIEDLVQFSVGKELKFKTFLGDRASPRTPLEACDKLAFILEIGRQYLYSRSASGVGNLQLGKKNIDSPI